MTTPQILETQKQSVFQNRIIGFDEFMIYGFAT